MEGESEGRGGRKCAMREKEGGGRKEGSEMARGERKDGECADRMDECSMSKTDGVKDILAVGELVMSPNTHMYTHMTTDHSYHSAASRTESQSHAISVVQWYPHDTGIFSTSSVDRVLRIWDTNELCVCLSGCGQTIM